MDTEKKTNEFEEELDDEELQELVLAAQEEALLKEKLQRDSPHIKPKKRMRRFILAIISAILFVNTFAILFQIYSIPAIDFLITSSRLSKEPMIKQAKEAVVVLFTEDSKGTGFSITEDGYIITNYHVVEGHDTISVAFQTEGRFTGTVVDVAPSIDLAIVKVDATALPHLSLSSSPSYESNGPIQFIGNPLSFTWIANEGTIVDDIVLSDWDQPVQMIAAPVYKGNSGSPVFDEYGQVIGVIFATLEHKEHRKVGLFVPVDAFFHAFPQFQAK